MTLATVRARAAPAVVAAAPVLRPVGVCDTPTGRSACLGSGRADSIRRPSAPPAASPSPTPLIGDVPMAPPTRLVLPAAGIDGPVEEYTAAEAEAEGGVNPAALDTISWYSGIPNPMPGSDAANTVYIFGHSWIEPAVFNGLKALHAGDRATITTTAGELVYEVDEIITMAKPDFTQDARVTAVVPGRLALVTCYRPPGWDPSSHAPDNTVVFLHLVEAHPAG